MRRGEGEGERRWVEGTSAVYRRSLVQDFYPAELRRNLWMPFPYPQDTNSTLPTRLLSFYRSYIPRRNGCPQNIARPDFRGHSCRSGLIGFLFLLERVETNIIDSSPFRIDLYPIVILLILYEVGIYCVDKNFIETQVKINICETYSQN